MAKRTSRAKCPVSPVSELASAWRERAEHLERYAPEVANAIRECTVELEQLARAVELAEVTPTEAMALTGYSDRALGEMIKESKLPNYGNRRRPRLKLVDLPRKPGHRSADIDLDILALSPARAIAR